jgi:hypothetical protein
MALGAIAQGAYMPRPAPEDGGVPPLKSYANVGGTSPVPVALPIDALGPAPRAELLHVLMLPDFERADRIGEFWGYPESRAFAELLIDCEEDRTLRTVLVGMLHETDH